MLPRNGHDFRLCLAGQGKRVQLCQPHVLDGAVCKCVSVVNDGHANWHAVNVHRRLHADEQVI